jgi:hypothetical protein
MIRFHKSAQDGWLQKQFFLQRSLAAAPRFRQDLSALRACGIFAESAKTKEETTIVGQNSKTGREEQN